MSGTDGQDYAERLVAHSGVWWKRLLPVQAPYTWNLRRQQLGRTLDVGCGIGRNLGTLGHGSVGVDHNPTSIEVARAAGHEAYTAEAWFRDRPHPERSFDSMLVAHVIEHLDRPAALALLRSYLPFVRPGGRAFLICPQERGFASDPTHVTWTDGEDLEALAREAGLTPEPWRSFPFPRSAGRRFTYNEFNVLAHLPST